MTENPPKSDAKMPWCHRFYIPVAYAEQTPAMPGLPARIEPKGNLIFMKCLGDQCAIYDKKRNQCSELSHNLAVANAPAPAEVL